MKYRGLEFPGVRAVAAALRAENTYLRAIGLRADDTGFCGDVRLQVYPDGQWALHAGDASYDTDHRGYWGCSSLDGERFDSMAMARQLIDDCKEHYAQTKDD